MRFLRRFFIRLSNFTTGRRLSEMKCFARSTKDADRSRPVTSQKQ
jgi:hypothetical protein